MLKVGLQALLPSFLQLLAQVRRHAALPHPHRIYTAVLYVRES